MGSEPAHVEPMRLGLTAPLSLAASTRRRAEGDHARLQATFDQNYAGVWRFLRRMGVDPHRADDAAQQVFLIALEAMPRITPGRERAFVFGTAVRVAHGVRRAPQREVPSAMDLGPSPLPSPDQLADQKRAREALDAIVERLEPDVRAVFVLSELEGLTTPEIAELLEIPLGTASSRLRRGREAFHQMVHEAYGDAP